MRLAVGYACYGGRVHWAHVGLYHRIASALAASGGIAMALMVDSPLLPRSRNLILQRALDAGADVLSMFDGDTWPASAGDWMTAIAKGLALGGAVIAAGVQQRGRPGLNLGDAEFPGDPTSPVTRIHALPTDRLSHVDRAGTAIMAIDLRWIREHWPWKDHKPWFADGYYSVVHEGQVEQRTFGEDFAFCAGVRRRGGKILAANIETVHQGASDYIGGTVTWRPLA